MIYKGSRYTKTPLVIDKGIKTFGTRDLAEFTYKNCRSHTVVEGDTIDGIALTYYGTSQYWWVIMDANPKYIFPTDISIGDSLLIPNISEVLTKL